MTPRMDTQILVRKVTLHTGLEFPDSRIVIDQVDHMVGRGPPGGVRGDVAAQTARVVAQPMVGVVLRGFQAGDFQAGEDGAEVDFPAVS